MAHPNENEAFLHVLKRRRTSRGFLDRPLPPGAMELILEAGRWAPSAANTQPWEILVIDDKKVQEELKEAYLQESLLHDRHYQKVSNKQAELITAPVLLGVCGEPRTEERYIDASEIPPRYREELFLLTMGAFIQNLLLMAAQLGLGSTWIARLARIPEVAEILGLPEWIRPISFVALGFGLRDAFFDEGLRIPIERKTHHNRFGRPYPASEGSTW